MKKLIDNLKYHIVDTTAMVTVINPIFSASEVGIAGMSDEVSINSRLIATALNYGGIGYAYGKGRKLSRKLFGITDSTKEWIQTSHDSIYSAMFSIPTGIVLYLAAGETDPEKIAWGTAAGIVYGVVTGPVTGYAIDIFDDMTGLKECNRRTYPKLIKKRKPWVKKAIAAGLVAGSIGAMGLIYSCSPKEDRLPTYAALPRIEQSLPSQEYKSAIKELKLE